MTQNKLPQEKVSPCRGDLRDWISGAEEIGELRRVSGAKAELEMGALTEWVCEKIPSRPAILFDAIPGYPPDYRVVVNYLNSLSKVAYTVGLAPDISARDFVALWRGRVGQIPSIPPVVRRDGPVMERVLSNDEVNLMEFPGPLWHERDGGRYLGTGHVVISQDPDGSWVNLGAYRAMTHDEKTIGLYISPGHHGRIHRDKYHARNQPMPVIMSLGHDPLLSLVGSMSVPYGVSEFDFAGGIREEPVEVIRGEITGLPFPATSELVLEGECFPGETRAEGPFGEWTGYYGSSTRSEPFVRVRKIYSRKDPIVMGAPPFRPALGGSYHGTAFRSALIWNELEAAGVPDVQGVWSPEATGRLMIFVSIRQRYPGHARQAALIASQCHAAAYMSRLSSCSTRTWISSTPTTPCGRSPPASILRLRWRFSGAVGAGRSIRSLPRRKKASTRR